MRGLQGGCSSSAHKPNPDELRDRPWSTYVGAGMAESDSGLHGKQSASQVWRCNTWRMRTDSEATLVDVEHEPGTTPSAIEEGTPVLVRDLHDRWLPRVAIQPPARGALFEVVTVCRREHYPDNVLRSRVPFPVEDVKVDPEA